MRDYWTCSRFADWLRGTPKPQAATSKGWREWKRQARSRHPVRFWLAETALDQLQSVLWWPMDRVYDVKYYVINRWVTRTHALTSSQLPRGQYHDMDQRMIHCLFDELVNFVEVEKAWKSAAFDPAVSERFRLPWYAVGRWRTRTWRSAEVGLSHLEWESNLGLEEPQAQNAREILVLYHWWKYVRPLRLDPDDESGWTAICEARSQARAGEELGFLEDLDDRTPEESQQSYDAIQRGQEFHKRNSEEDTEMLIRLVRIRESLWT